MAGSCGVKAPNSDEIPTAETQEFFSMKAPHEESPSKRGPPELSYPGQSALELILTPNNFFGLPDTFGRILFEKKNNAELYDWQKEVLKSKAVENRENLIISVATPGGETVVAEILALREAILNNKDVIFVEPTFAIVQEKIASLAGFVKELGCQVAEYADCKGTFPPAKSSLRKTIFVATIEKAARLVDNFLEEGRLSSEVGLICVNKLHLLGQERGELLETMLTKVMFSEADIHVVGLSAIIGNPVQLCTFLKASLLSVDVPSRSPKEWVLCGESVARCNQEKTDDPLQIVRKVTLTASDPDYFVGITKEALQNGPCLIFCPTPQEAENASVLIGSSEYGTASDDGNALRDALLRALKVEGFGRVCPKLEQTIPFGVAYHHSGMTVWERQLLEEAFHIGTISCLTCTSTLETGVNLSTRTVIIRSPLMGMQPLTVSQYRQMICRAGPTGRFPEGDSYLMCGKDELSQVAAVLSKPVENCISRLVISGESAMLALGAIVIGLAKTEDRLISLFNCSFFKIVSSSTEASLARVVNAALVKLRRAGALLNSDTGGGSELKATQYGRAVYRGNLSTKESVLLPADLKAAAEGINLTNHMHRLYLAIPYEIAESITPNWTRCFEAVQKLDGIESKALESTRVSLSGVARLESCKKPRRDQDLATVRVFCCLMLHWLLKDYNPWDVADAFEVSRGEILALKTAAANFAGSIARFSKEIEELEWAPSMFGELSEKIQYSCCSSLRPLMDISYFRLVRARQFVQAGFASVEAVADANVEILVNCVDHLPGEVAVKIISCAKLQLLKEEDAAVTVLHGKSALSYSQVGTQQFSDVSQRLSGT